MSWTIWYWPIPDRAFYIAYQGWRVAWPLRNIKLLLGNCLPGLLAIVLASIQGKEQLVHLLSSLTAWRTQFKWYALAIAFPCGVFVVSLCLAPIFFRVDLRWPPTSTIIIGLVSTLFGPVWEEIAWRAFALRKLECRYSRLISALIIGTYWAVWHIPMWLLTLSYLTFPLLLVICANLVCWSVIFTFLYERSGQSLPVTILLHATYVAVQIWVGAALSQGLNDMIIIAASLSAGLAIVVGNDLTSSKDAPLICTQEDVNSL